MLSLSPASAADATTFYLDDVSFAGGGTATGSFTTNSAGFVESHDIVTTTGVIAGYHYIDDINVSYNPGDASITFYHNDPAYDGFLTLQLASPIDGITTAALLTSSLECSSYSCPNGTARQILSGSITTTSPVPEPASWVLMTIGFGGMAAALRRSRKGMPERASAG